MAEIASGSGFEPSNPTKQKLGTFKSCRELKWPWEDNLYPKTLPIEAVTDTGKHWHNEAILSIVHYTVPPVVERRLFLVENGQVDEQSSPQTFPPWGCWSWSPSPWWSLGIGSAQLKESTHHPQSTFHNPQSTKCVGQSVIYNCQSTLHTASVSNQCLFQPVHFEGLGDRQEGWREVLKCFLSNK